MKKLFEIALRNIKRNKRRTFLAIVSVGLAVMFVVILQGLIDGMVENIVINSTKNETGHIRITTKEYLNNIDTPSIQHLVYNPKEIMEYILSDKIISTQIRLITQRIKFPVILQYRGNYKTALCIAGDIKKEKDLLMLDKAIVKGEYLSGRIMKKNGKVFREIIIGEKLAEILQLKIGDGFSLMLQTIDFSPRIPNFYVKGIFKTGLNIFDENIFMINLEDAKHILKTEDGVQEILIMLKKHKRAKKLANYINQMFANKKEYDYLIALDWRSASGFVKMMEQSIVIYNLLYIGVVFLGSVIITNIMLMIVLERKREIGILKSIGFNKLQILFLFTLEGGILGSIGSICGGVLGAIINIPLSIYGIDFSSSIGSMNYPMDNVVRWNINLESVLSAVFLGVLVSSVMSVLPARYAAKIKPIDALKSV